MQTKLYQLASGFLLLAGLCSAPEAHGWTADELRQMDACQLQRVFEQGQVCAAPVGLWRGQVLVRVDTHHPRVRARLASLVWKGKYFDCDGTMINQWAGFRAVETELLTGTSWHDGQPCFVLDYPTDAAVFGNTRDEIREVCPGVLLGRFYERSPCPQLQGYFVLERARKQR